MLGFTVSTEFSLYLCRMKSPSKAMEHSGQAK